jgi:small subunit ribosomal protein S17
MAEEEKNETIEESSAAGETAAEVDAEAPATDEATKAEVVPSGETGGEAPSAQPEPEKNRKRLPRRLRPQKTRPTRAASTGARKPVAREPKPEHERGRRQERRGVVVSSAMDKTIIVRVELIKSHPRYKKVVRRSVKFHAHDEQNAANVGDLVRIVETRPLSATKRWRLAEVLEAAK